MGEHITGFVNIHILSDNSTPPGQVTKLVITIAGELKQNEKQQLVQAIKKVGSDFGLAVQEL